jgi:proteasome activator subunit 4
MAIEHAEDDVRMEEVLTEESVQYLYNAWLPVAQESRTEKHRFHEVVSLLQLTWKPHDLDTRFATLKWIPVISMFLKVKSQLDLQDLEAVVKIGLDVILQSSDNFFVQVRWGQLLVSKILKKFGKKLELTIEWQPLYKLVHDAHFKRRKSYEGLALNQIHLENMTSLVRLCRRFFPPTAAIEIWREFRPAFEDLSHNSSLEAVGFVSLFLPSTLHIDGDVDTALLTRDWLIEVLHLWAAVPNCNFWNLQWASLLSRVIKHSSSWEVWEPLLPTLFTFYLRSFEVPVGGASASSPIQWEIPRDSIIAFNSGWSLSASKVNAKSIVYLLKEGGSAQHELEVLVDLLEQFVFLDPALFSSWSIH